MSHRATVTAAAIVAVAATVLGPVLMVASGVTWHELIEGNAVAQGVAAASLATVGAVVLQRLPGHMLGRLFLGIGLAEAVGQLAGGIAARLSAGGARGLPLSVTAWLSGWIWLPGLLVLLSLVVLLFPDGRAARQWRPVVGLAVVATLAATIAAALVRELTSGVAAGAENPAAVAALPDDVLYVVVFVGMAVAASPARRSPMCSSPTRTPSAVAGTTRHCAVGSPELTVTAPSNAT